jgi:hypothetical protein
MASIASGDALCVVVAGMAMKSASPELLSRRQGVEREIEPQHVDPWLTQYA